MAKTKPMKDLALFFYEHHGVGETVEERDHSRRIAFFTTAQRSPITPAEDLLSCWQELERLIGQLPHKG